MSEAAVAPALGRGYLTAWAVLGALSAGYLVFVAWDGAGSSVIAGGDLGTKVAQLSSDVSGLKEKVSGLSALQNSDHERLAALETTVETRLSGLAENAAKVVGASESAAPRATATANAPKVISVPGVMLVTTKPAPPSAVPAPKPQADAGETAQDPATQPRKPTKILASAPGPETPAQTTDTAQSSKATAKQKVAVSAKSSDAYKPANGTTSQAAAIETGSLPSRGASGPVGLEVASAGSLDAARQSWGGISSRAGDALAGTEARIMPSVDGTAFRVIAGPYSNEADAQKACVALKARGVACRATGFGGAPL